MLVWIILIIILTVSMILSYYLIPDSPEIVVVHAYGILLVALGVLYRVFRKMRARRVENLLSELNYLRMKVAQFEQKYGGEVEGEESRDLLDITKEKEQEK